MESRTVRFGAFHAYSEADDMSHNDARETALAEIERNIRSHGQHIYAVGISSVPKFCYTIGLRESALAAELVVPGAGQFTIDEIADALNALGEGARTGVLDMSAPFTTPHLGAVGFAEAHTSWVNRLLLGAVDYYWPNPVAAYQVVLESVFRTIDTPDLSQAWDPVHEPVWRWLELPWEYAISESTSVVTDLQALRGAHITEVCHWEDDAWELIAAGDEPPEQQGLSTPSSK